MSGFLTYFLTPAMGVSLLVWLSSCCYGTHDEEILPTLEFVIVDQTGANVLLSNTLPVNVIWYYREGAKAEANHPYPDFDRGVFEIKVMPGNNYRIDILNQSFVQLDLSFSKQKEQCASYDRISGVIINGTPWDYQSHPVLTLVYNP